jgi:hypothetical protein
MKISYKQYLDKVNGCWLGKSIAGTIGAPLEGRKELFFRYCLIFTQMGCKYIT